MKKKIYLAKNDLGKGSLVPLESWSNSLQVHWFKTIKKIEFCKQYLSFFFEI